MQSFLIEGLNSKHSVNTMKIKSTLFCHLWVFPFSDHSVNAISSSNSPIFFSQEAELLIESNFFPEINNKKVVLM